MDALMHACVQTTRRKKKKKKTYLRLSLTEGLLTGNLFGGENYAFLVISLDLPSKMQLHLCKSLTPYSSGLVSLLQNATLLQPLFLCFILKTKRVILNKKTMYNTFIPRQSNHTCVAPTEVTQGLLAGKLGAKGVFPSLEGFQSNPDSEQDPSFRVGIRWHLQSL